MMGWQWHQLDHMQIICTSLQTDNHASTSRLIKNDQLISLSMKTYIFTVVSPLNWRLMTHGVILS